MRLLPKRTTQQRRRKGRGGMTTEIVENRKHKIKHRNDIRILIGFCIFGSWVTFMNHTILASIESLSSFEIDFNKGYYSSSSPSSNKGHGVDNNRNMNNVFDDDTTLIKDTLSLQDLKSNLKISKYPLKEVTCHLNIGENARPIKMHDTGTISWVCNNGGEKQVTKVMLHVFNEYYTNLRNQDTVVHGNGVVQNLMLDIGSNAGYYGLLAATYGLKVVAFEIQPECAAVILHSVLVNHLGENMRVIPKGVSEGRANETTTLLVPEEGCDGGFPFADGNQSSKLIDVELHPLGYYLPCSSNIEIKMMKVDTEGNEKRVLAGALQFFANQQIKNAIVEVTPGHGFWSKAGVTAKEMSEVLIQIIDEHMYAMIPLIDEEALVFRANMLHYVGAQYKTTIFDEERIVFTDGEKATGYILSDASPTQFDIWLLPSQDLHKISGNATLIAVSTGAINNKGSSRKRRNHKRRENVALHGK